MTLEEFVVSDEYMRLEALRRAGGSLHPQELAWMTSLLDEARKDAGEYVDLFWLGWQEQLRTSSVGARADLYGGVLAGLLPEYSGEARGWVPDVKFFSLMGYSYPGYGRLSLERDREELVKAGWLKVQKRDGAARYELTIPQ